MKWGKAMPTYTVHDIANYFLFKAEQEDQELLSNMKLQKLIYYAQGLHLAIGEGPLFNSPIEAWTYGPVVPEIYHKYKEYGRGGIPTDEGFDPSVIDADTRDFLDEVFDVFGQFSAFRLMDLSHSDKCWVDAGDGNVITIKSMAESLKKYLSDG